MGAYPVAPHTDKSLLPRASCLPATAQRRTHHQIRNKPPLPTETSQIPGGAVLELRSHVTWLEDSGICCIFYLKRRHNKMLEGSKMGLTHLELCLQGSPSKS